MDISIIIEQMLILFLMIGIGFILNKTHILGGAIDGGITKLILYCTMPAMVLNSVLSRTGEKDTKTVVSFLVIAVVTYILLPIVAWLVTKILRIQKNIQGIYMFMIIFANIGFMGFPLISALYGPECVLYAGIFNMIFNLLAYSYGVIIVSKDNNSSEFKYKFSPKSLLTPGISVSLLALIIYFINISVPTVVSSVVSSIGNLTTPLAMMIVGSTLGKMKIRELFNDKRVYVFVVMRSIILPLLLFPLLKLLIKDDFMLQFSFILLIMPVANSSVLYAKEYGSDELLAAKCVILTTLISIITIPALMLICF